MPIGAPVSILKKLYNNEGPVLRIMWIITLLASSEKEPKYIFYDIYIDTFCGWYILLSINQ